MSEAYRLALGIFVAGSLVVIPAFVYIGLGRDSARKRQVIRWFAFAYALLVGGFSLAVGLGAGPEALLAATLGAALAGAVAFYVIWTLVVCDACAAVTPRVRPLVAPERCRSCGTPFARAPR